MTTPKEVIEEAAAMQGAHTGLTLEAALLAMLVAAIRSLTQPAGGRQ